MVPFANDMWQDCNTEQRAEARQGSAEIRERDIKAGLKSKRLQRAKTQTDRSVDAALAHVHACSGGAIVANSRRLRHRHIKGGEHVRRDVNARAAAEACSVVVQCGVCVAASSWRAALVAAW
jgi:hypothetical protein